MFARRQWEGVIGYMVGSAGIDLSDDGVRLSQGVETLMEIGNLVTKRGKKIDITQDGFAFILQEVNAQVWTILILYLQNAEAVRIPNHNDAVKITDTLCTAENGHSRCALFPLHARIARAWSCLLEGTSH